MEQASPATRTPGARPDAFVSYSRRNAGLAGELVDAARSRGAVFWRDAADLVPGSTWLQELRRAIESADAVVCVLTEDWVHSAECRREYELAEACGKRIIPAVFGEVELAGLPPGLRSRHWIDGSGREVGAVVADILTAVAIDTDLVHEHTLWLDRALRWESGGRESSMLLRGRQLQQAERWLVRAGTDPAPTALQQGFVNASRSAERRRQRRSLVLVSTALLVSVVLAVVAVVQRVGAVRQRDTAIARELVADSRSAPTLLDPRRRRLEAVAAWHLHPSAETYTAMLQAVASPISAAVLTPNPAQAVFDHRGALLATVGDFGFVELRDARSLATVGSPFLVPQPDRYVATAVAFSPDDRMVAAGDADGTVRLWDVSTQHQIGTPLRGSAAAVGALRFAPGAAVLVAGSQDGSLRAWTVASRRPLWRVGPVVTGPVRSLDVSPDGRSVAVGVRGGAVVYSLRTGVRQRTLPVVNVTGSEPAVVSFSPDGSTLAVSGAVIDLWNLRTGRSSAIVATLGSAVGALSFSPDGRILASADDNNSTVSLWSVRDRRALGPPLTGQGGVVSALCYSPDGHTVASSSSAALVLWDVRSGRPLGDGLPAGSGPVRAVAVSPDGRSIATADADGALVLWDAAGRRRRWTVARASRSGSSGLYAVTFSPDGASLATAAADGTVRRWDTGTGRQLGAPFSGGTGALYAVAISPDGRTIAAGGADRVLRWWDVGSHRLDGSLPPDVFDVRAITGAAFRADGTLVAVSPGGGAVIWDLQKRAPVGHLVGLDTRTLALNRSGDTAVLADRSSVLLFSTKDQLTRGELDGSRLPVLAAAFSPDAQLIATAGRDGVRLWSRGDPQLIAIVATADTRSVALDPTGTYLVTGSADGTVQTWDTTQFSDVRTRLCHGPGGRFDARDRTVLPTGPSYHSLCG